MRHVSDIESASSHVGRHENRQFIVLETAQGASALLRRAALARYARAEVAPLCGEAWLAFLDRSGRTTAFTGGAGRALVLAPYDPVASCDQDALHAACRDWLRRHR